MKNKIIYPFALSFLFLLNACFVDIDDDVFKTQSEKTPSIIKQSRKNYISYDTINMLFFSNDKKQVIYDSHSSWTHSNVAYDNTTEELVVIYNVKPVHRLSNNKVAMRKIDKNGFVGKAIVVADKIREGVSCKSLSSGITGNGDYLSFVGLIDNSSEKVIGTNIYRSTDKGETWQSNKMIVDGEPLKAFWGDVSGFLLLKNGRILTLACHEVTRQVRIVYSDDNGYTWSFAQIPTCYKHTEPAWCELSDGAIICYLRNSVADDGYKEKKPAVFMKSEDGGLTWSKPVKSQSIMNMTEANGQLIYHAEIGIVEFVYHSRYTEEDGFSSIFHSIAKEEDAKVDRMGESLRIAKLPPQDNGGDSGYIGGSLTTKNTTFITFYSGTNVNADIFYMIGNKSQN